MIEELTRKEATIIIIDPHADYVSISRPKDDRKHLFSDRVTVFRNPVSTSRFGARNVGKVEPYDVALTNLTADEICDVSGIPERATNIAKRSGGLWKV